MEAHRNNSSRGLAVMISHVLPTTVPMVEVFSRISATPTAVVVSAISSFLKNHGCGRRGRTSISGVKTRPATITHIPPCVTRCRSIRTPDPRCSVLMLCYSSPSMKSAIYAFKLVILALILSTNGCRERSSASSSRSLILR